MPALPKRASRSTTGRFTIYGAPSIPPRMADLGVQPHIVEAVLNHVSGHKAGVAGIYNRATYDKEKRAALNLWAEHVTALVDGRKAVVVPMKRA